MTPQREPWRADEPIASPPVAVVVVSGVRFYAEGLALALGVDERISVLLAVPGADALVAVLGDAEPDVVLLDLAGVEDVDELRQIVSAAAPLPFVALAVRERDTDVIRWAEAGVAGIVTRSASLQDLSAAIFAAARGESPLSPTVPAVLLRRVAAAAREGSDAPSLPPLTAREREVADLLVLGLTNKEIAARLFLGVPTVKNHVHNLLRKLDASSRAEAVARMNRAAGVMQVAVRAAAARQSVTDPRSPAR